MATGVAAELRHGKSPPRVRERSALRLARSDTRNPNVLVRRGKELNGPEFMVHSRQSILFIEPVREEPEIGRSIAGQSVPTKQK